MLFDYETSSVHKKSLKILSPCVITRSGNDISISNENENESLVLISNNSSTYNLMPTPSHPLWLVIRSARNSAEPSLYQLSEGTVLKLGRLQFKVKSIKTKEDRVDEANAIIGLEKDILCKVCLCENNDPINPLISICKCAGTLKYIHIECLQQWISSKIITNVTENSVMKYLKSIHCELCGVRLPFIVNINNVSYDLLKGQKPQEPYLILEGIQSEYREPGIYFISLLNKSSVMIGRGHDSDVRIPDISVSRCHAKISYINGNFMIQDNFSKFGTLIMIKEQVEINSQIAIQCGRTVLQFSKNPVNGDKFEWEQD